MLRLRILSTLLNKKIKLQNGTYSDPIRKQAHSHAYTGKVWKLCGLLAGLTLKTAVGRLQEWEKTVFNLVKSSTFSNNHMLLL